MIAFNYFLQLTDKFDRAMKIFTFTLTIALVVRNSSPIGWIPLIACKVIYNKSIMNYLESAVRVFLPTLTVCILLDSIYFGHFTITAWNFFKVNVIDNRSAEFGVSSPMQFIYYYLPEALGNYTCWLIVLGIIYNLYECVNKRKIPYILVFSTFYLFVISNIPHKEDRF